MNKNKNNQKNKKMFIIIQSALYFLILKKTEQNLITINVNFNVS